MSNEMNTMRYALPMMILLALPGCSTVKAINEPFSIGENSAAALPGRELGAPENAAPRKADTARRQDDFIEVDDEAGIRKTWPMLLFIGLLTLGAAAF